MPNTTPPASGDTSWSIADGLFTMHLPDGWQYSADSYTNGEFALPSGHTLSCHVETYEAPERIAEGGLAPFAREEGMDVPDLSDSDIIGNVLMLFRPARDGVPSGVNWTTLDVLADRYIRIVRFSLPCELGDDGDGASSIDGFLRGVTQAINLGRFADDATPLDRVGPTPKLKRVTPWGVILIRVPEYWRYERAEDGRYVCDVLPEQAPPDPTLWFDYNQFSAPSDKGELLGNVRDMAAGLAETLGPPGHVQVHHDSGGSWIESIAHGEEDGTPLVFYNMHRMVAGDARVLMAHFNLVLTAADAETEAGRDLIDLMHREIHNAIVLPNRPGEDPDAETH